MHRRFRLPRPNDWKAWLVSATLVGVCLAGAPAPAQTSSTQTSSTRTSSARTTLAQTKLGPPETWSTDPVKPPTAPDTKPPSLAAPALPSPGTPKPPQVAVPQTTTPPQPGAAQPTLPSAAGAAPPKPGSPVVEQITRKPLVVRKRAVRVAPAGPRRRYARRRDRLPLIERPALAGVELVAPLPAPGEPPHVFVPTPAYPLEAAAAAITTPPPPIRCHPTRRDRYAPDPHLYREVPVECEPDNP